VSAADKLDRSTDMGLHDDRVVIFTGAAFLFLSLHAL
jgi:hypothetical protein